MPSDIQKIIAFNTRMGMFICPWDKSHVMAFLSGYECRSESEFKLTKEIKRILIQKHSIEENALGWPDQLERFAQKNGIRWMDAYLLISSEILNEKLNILKK